MASNRSRRGRGALRAHLRRDATRLLQSLRGGSQRGTGFAGARIALASPCPRYHRLFDPACLSMLAERTHSGGVEHRNDAERLSDRLRAIGPWRPLAPAPDRNVLDVMREHFPNFASVIDFIDRQIALATSTPSRIFTMPPILLLGEPGIGKTAFTKKLAAVMGTAYLEISMENATAGFTLAGLDNSWGGAKPGRIFQSLAFETVSNPLVLLDEVDKGNGDPRFDVGQTLLALLERNNARTFVDEYAAFPIDASRINWIGTANTDRTLSAPLLSRFQVFHVAAPAPGQASRVVRSIYSELRASTDWGGHFAETLSDEVVDALRELNPREASRALIDAAGEAALRGRRHITKEDLHVFKRHRPAAGIGFQISR